MVQYLAPYSLRRLSWHLLVLVLLLSPAMSGCRLFHPYRMPTPKGPVIPKQKRSKKAVNTDAAAADGSDLNASKEPAKVQKNSYTKNGLLKKPKYERRRLKKKVGQRKFLGVTLPW
ncbi:hypothetical protein [Hymenobacter koreensis]|uniref:Uncharacterized protein n=1 Tax=Hymenobacter koreensis TaxID=1084523 RepID=A0ABP8JL32_9BACT